MQTEASLRQDLLRTCHVLYQQGLVAGSTGSLSVRLSPNEILCTQSNSHKGLITDEDLLVIDLQGDLLRGVGEIPIEASIHLSVYRSRPSVRAVVHAHPPICMAFTLAGLSLEPPVLPTVVRRLGTIVTLPYQTLGTDELAQLVGDTLLDKDGVLLERQGAVCVGGSLLDALSLLEEMEQLARVVLQARSLGVVQPLDPDESVKLRAVSLKRDWVTHDGIVEEGDVPHMDLPFVATEDLPQPIVDSDPFENRRRLIDPNGLYGI